MSFYFSLFETVSLFASAFIVNYLVLDGRANYLEGALLISAYVITTLVAFFYPSCENLSSASGAPDAELVKKMLASWSMRRELGVEMVQRLMFLFEMITTSQ
ncbi:Ca2+:H+ antiporter [[Emmonsia] crescens]|uniref:Ca2+:H+ antiporter n=1 Tax=[Emmonsia] crescens TaxID=73230 RepID=A0A0G2JAK1_9EURO|nr:Ca2+:H+ antiporter [Emmonsia crescens UAMH 3008]